MNNDVEVEARPRPLSTGLWTLFSWLRRDDRSASSESLSSAGSDRTVASFAFLTPARYQPAKGPLVVPPPGPPTDSYKKRVHDRNIRRHYDRDITLHRKYGLFKSEGSCGYDAFSLPPARRTNTESGTRWDRERRATSECYQRRLAHVPGKRRAPLPPGTTAGPSASLPRRHSRKRPAPQPPVRVLEKNKEIFKEAHDNLDTVQMHSNTYQDKSKAKNNDVMMGCKSEKYIKKEASNKDSKLKTDKSFLRHIFDGKKRNSYIDTSAVKLLPSISELDKQAAEFIETCKLKANEQNNNSTFGELNAHSSNKGDAWICTRCFKRYNSSIVTCTYCVSKQKSQPSEIVADNKTTVAKASNSYTQTGNDLIPDRKYDAEDKQKLKEMLKEMKDSLPKRPKHDFNSKTGNQITAEPQNLGKKSFSTETPTLRVGSTIHDEIKSISKPSTSSQVKLKPTLESTYPSNNPVSAQAALVAQVISVYKKNVNDNVNLAAKLTTKNDIPLNVKQPEKLPQNQAPEKNHLNTPLKISSLLNPMYIPKNSVVNKPDVSSEEQTNLQNANIVADIVKDTIKCSQNTAIMTTSTSAHVGPSTSRATPIPGDIDIEHKNKEKSKKVSDPLLKAPSPNISTEVAKIPEPVNTEENKNKPTSFALPKDQNAIKTVEALDQHSRRRDLINQLEKSIAQGDERAAAEAAAKLAQLRLSCSVLSFSSQILSRPSTSAINNNELKKSADKPKIALATAPSTSSNKDSDKNDKKESQGSKINNVKEISPPKVSITNNITTGNMQSDAVTTSPVPRTVPTKALLLPQKNRDEKVVHKKEEEINPVPNTHEDKITIAVLVEDREATRGPVHLRVSRRACTRDLRYEAERLLGLAPNLQRWIIGRALCVNDDTPIISLAGPDFSAPFYLCVVESETKLESNSQQNKDTATAKTNNQQTKSRDVYTELMQLEQQAVVPNAENFECGICMEEYRPGQGVVLRDCVHIFCKDCLSDVVRHCEEPDVPCPAMGCRGMLQEREIRALVSTEDYERWLARGLAAAESGTRNAFHCRTRDCTGWALCDPGVQRFPCPVCKCINCVPCQAIHPGDTCEQHRAKLKQAASEKVNGNTVDDGTRTLLNSLISKGEALECPECSAIITKKWGCDWVKCSACKTEICWVTRGRRWGPGGKGDTTGGCRCGVDGKRCHPSCGYCH
ncbi:hypothetical protein HW555_013270 [Spodoptera exigua]|uniref:RanBP-type and C3HC4-type zinc finger-containing protein 1 n=1 Tax=Spodoptera exigua TaxID=7107 RepID=A0A835KX58_SPOEX|nr:hypothetical protein HW555_013270 [Spodoptera exigua]